MTVIEYLNKNGFNPLQDIEKNEGEDFVELYQIIENCIEAINKNSVIPDVIEMTNRIAFKKKYQDFAHKDFLDAVWRFGDKQWSDGYDQGYRDPNFELDE